MSWEFRWANDARAHGMPTCAELEAAGYQRIAQPPVYPAAWLMWRAA